MSVETSSIYQRSLSAHLPREIFEKLQSTSVLVAGLGGGSNAAELLVRKGFGEILLTDPDEYEVHNIRQRGCAQSTLGQNKTEVMAQRLLDIQPNLKLHSIPLGVNFDNIPELVAKSNIVIDMLDFSAIAEKIALSREAQQQGKYLLTAPSIVNGGALFVFAPGGMSLEEFWGHDESQSLEDQALAQMRKIIPFAPPEAPMEMYLEAAKGLRSIPLDAVGVEQASVMLVSAAENIALGRFDRLVVMPYALQIDVSNPMRGGYHIHNFSR
jgi:molybdopterin/thiamine biosynthesis adenylyltransferase